MIKKIKLIMLISLVSIAFLFSGCSSDNNDKAPTITVESDVNSGNIESKDIVDSTFTTDTISNTSDVEIGSLI